MNKKELTQWLRVKNENNIVIQIPNEIFKDLGESNFKSWKHRPFAYSYYYLISYLYRVTIYGNTPEEYGQDKILRVFLKRPDLITYITKRDGLLDKIGYTESESNFPISTTMDDNGILHFHKFKELQNDMGKNLLPNLGGRFYVKKPIKAFVRFDDEDYTGTFYDSQNTHRITIEKFIDIITDEELGHVALYVYAYLVYSCKKFPKGFIISNKNFADAIGYGERSLSKYTLLLESKGYITSTRAVSKDKMYEKAYFVE